MACKKGQFDVVDQFKTFSTSLNAQHVNGMTPFDLALSTVVRYSRVVGQVTVTFKSMQCWETLDSLVN